MKRNGFTLIELLIVTVVIVTLMGVVFRLAGSGSDNKKRAVTIERLQKLENALSGYYAAFGSYPPVPLQGRSRDINARVDELGIQSGSSGDKQDVSLKEAANEENWWKGTGTKNGKQILAACKAQPVAVLFPYNEKERDLVEALSKVAPKNGKSYSVIHNAGALAGKDNWADAPVFQFGLLSFLLPRYTFMLQGDKDLYDYKDKNGRRVGQWAANNRLPCLMDGYQVTSWQELQEYMAAGKRFEQASSNPERAVMVSNMTSQAVCARWMPNFKNMIYNGFTFFGVKTEETDGLDPEGYDFPPVFSAGGYNSSSQLYRLECMTVIDGWGHEFFYSSEPPYQSYRLWSAGPDGKTFPPWLALPSNKDERDYVRGWLSDDIVHLSN